MAAKTARYLGIEVDDVLDIAEQTGSTPNERARARRLRTLKHQLLRETAESIARFSLLRSALHFRHQTRIYTLLDQGSGPIAISARLSQGDKRILPDSEHVGLVAKPVAVTSHLGTRRSHFDAKPIGICEWKDLVLRLEATELGVSQQL